MSSSKLDILKPLTQPYAWRRENETYTEQNHHVYCKAWCWPGDAVGLFYSALNISKTPIVIRWYFVLNLELLSCLNCSLIEAAAGLDTLPINLNCVLVEKMGLLLYL